MLSCRKQGVRRQRNSTILGSQFESKWLTCMCLSFLKYKTGFLWRSIKIMPGKRCVNLTLLWKYYMMMFFGNILKHCCVKNSPIKRSPISFPLCLFNFQTLSSRSSSVPLNVYYLALDEILDFIPSKARLLVFIMIS